MKTKMINVILFIILIITTTAIAEDIKPFQLTVLDWSELKKDDKINCCLYYLFEAYQQGRLKKWVRREFQHKRSVIFMAQKLSRSISITIIKEQNISNNIFELSLAEMTIEGWL